jgi:hypothetical protein
LSSDHSQHDRLLIARFAGDDAYHSERADAERLVGSCSECAALAADIRLLALRTADVPAPRRPRDFRMSMEQAAAVRGSWFQRTMRRLAAPGLGTLRPVAGAAFAIGLTMTVAGALPVSTMSGGAAAPAQDGRVPVELPAASAAKEQHQPAASDMGVPGSEAVPDTAPLEGEIGRAGGTPMPLSGEHEGSYADDDTSGEVFVGPLAEPAATSNRLLYIGLLIATGALAVLLLAVVARRRFGDPLLR